MTPWKASSVRRTLPQGLQRRRRSKGRGRASRRTGTHAPCSPCRGRVGRDEARFTAAGRDDHDVAGLEFVHLPRDHCARTRSTSRPGDHCGRESDPLVRVVRRPLATSTTTIEPSSKRPSVAEANARRLPSGDHRGSLPLSDVMTRSWPSEMRTAQVPIDVPMATDCPSGNQAGAACGVGAAMGTGRIGDPSTGMTNSRRWSGVCGLPCHESSHGSQPVTTSGRRHPATRPDSRRSSRSREG